MTEESVNVTPAHRIATRGLVPRLTEIGGTPHVCQVAVVLGRDTEQNRAIRQLNGLAIRDSAFSRRRKTIGTDARGVPRAAVIRRTVYEAVPVTLQVLDIRIWEVTGHQKSSVCQAAKEGFTSQYAL